MLLRSPRLLLYVIGQSLRVSDDVTAYQFNKFISFRDIMVPPVMSRVISRQILQ